MKKIACFLLFMIVAIDSVYAQNKYAYKDVQVFKQGMLASAREMTKSVPIQINEIQTLKAIGVTENLITYSYEISEWDGRFMMTEDDIKQTKSLTALNILRSQQYLDLFLECLRRTKFEYQFIFFSEDKKYIGGFRLTYKDFIKK